MTGFQPNFKAFNVPTTPKTVVPSAIFLDLEGPIVSYDSIVANTTFNDHYAGASTFRWIDWADPIALKLVFRLAIDFNSKIVVTSVLRFEKRVTAQLYYFFQDLADKENVENPYAGETVRSKDREDEIRQYIKENSVQKFVVIDDRELNIENFVLIGRRGFRFPEYEDCKQYLFDETKHSQDLLKPPLVFL